MANGIETAIIKSQPLLPAVLAVIWEISTEEYVVIDNTNKKNICLFVILFSTLFIKFIIPHKAIPILESYNMGLV